MQGSGIAIEVVYYTVIMNILRPNYVARAVEALTPESITERTGSVRVVAFDVDGTLSDYHADRLEPSVKETLYNLGQSGLSLWVISNAYNSRADELVDVLEGVVSHDHIVTPKIVADGNDPKRYRKPSPAMLRYVAATEAVDTYSILMVGDQMFKDIVSANRAGAQSVLVPKRGERDHVGVRFQRPVEALARAGLGLPLTTSRYPDELTATGE